MPGVVVSAAAMRLPPLGEGELPLPECPAAGPVPPFHLPPPPPPKRVRPLRRAVGRGVPAALPGGSAGGGVWGHPVAAGPGRSPPGWRGRRSRRQPGLPVTAHFLVGWGRRGAAAGSVPDGLGGRRELRQAAMRAPGPAGRRPPP